MALKKTPNWDKGRGAQSVPSAAPKGHPIRETPHFKPVSTVGKPRAGVDPRPIKDRGARGKAR